MTATLDIPNAMDGIEEAVAKMLASIKPASEAECRAYTFQTIIAGKIEGAGFPKRFVRDGFSTDNRKQIGVYNQILKRLTGVGAVLVMAGERGTGKTTVAAQVAVNWAWGDRDAGKQGRGLWRTIGYDKMTEIIARLKAMYGDFGTIKGEELIALRDRMVELDLLIIDELHEAGDDSKHMDRILTDIVDRRYSVCRDTILITNQKPDEFWKVTNPSIKSRINEHGAVIPCEWDSFRDKF